MKSGIDHPWDSLASDHKLSSYLSLQLHTNREEMNRDSFPAKLIK